MESDAERGNAAWDGCRQGSAQVVRRYGWCTPNLHGVEVYREWCRVLNLPPVAGGYGVFLVHDTANDVKFTAATPDTRYVCLLHHGLEELGCLEDVEVPPDKFTVRVGWPDLPQQVGN